MIGNSKENAVAIPLKVWQDPQGNPLMIFSEHNCEIYVGCWIEAGIPAEYICKITFISGWASRCYGVEYLPYEIKEHLRSAIFELTNSLWLKESSEYRLKCYPEWKTWDNLIYHHYIIQGHNNYIEIIAESYKEEVISMEDAETVLPSMYLKHFNQ